MGKINGNLLMCLAEIVMGILLLINPFGFTSGIISTFAILLAVLGISYSILPNSMGTA